MGKQTMGFGGDIKTKLERKKTDTFKSVVPHDIVKFGLIPELVGRIPVMVPLNDLDEDALVRILTEPKNSLIKQYEKLFRLDGVKLTFDDSSLRAVAKLALERNTGARGLRSLLESAMQEIMYEIPSRLDIAEVKITPACINGTGKSDYIYNKDLLAEPPAQLTEGDE